MFFMTVLMITNYRSNPAFLQFISKTHITLFDIDTKSLSQHQFHVGGMTEAYHSLQNHVDPIVGIGQSVEMRAVMYGGIPRHNCTYLEYI